MAHLTIQKDLRNILSHIIYILTKHNHKPEFESLLQEEVYVIISQRSDNLGKRSLLSLTPRINMGAVPDIEYTALKMFIEFKEKLREGGISLWLASLNPEPLKVIERSPLRKTLGHERMFFNLQKAVEAFHTQSRQA